MSLEFLLPLNTTVILHMTFSLVLTTEPRVEILHCCEAMTTQVNIFSPNVASPLLGTSDKRIYWSPIFNEYGLICQPSAEVLVTSHCPFCGFLLPPSQRDAWFDALEKTGWQTWAIPFLKNSLSMTGSRYNPAATSGYFYVSLAVY